MSTSKYYPLPVSNKNCFQGTTRAGAKGARSFGQRTSREGKTRTRRQGEEGEGGEGEGEEDGRDAESQGRAGPASRRGGRQPAL